MFETTDLLVPNQEAADCELGQFATQSEGGQTTGALPGSPVLTAFLEMLKEGIASNFARAVPTSMDNSSVLAQRRNPNRE